MARALNDVPPGWSAAAIVERWCRVVSSLRDAAGRVAWMRSELTRLPIPEAAEALSAVARRAEQADPVGREVLAACVPFLSDPAFSSWIASLRFAAAAGAHWPLDRLLRRPPVTTRRSGDPEDPARSEGRDADPAAAPPLAPRVATAKDGRPLTLGERRALARRPSRAELARVLSDPHPMVVQNVLANPRTTEDDVLRLVTRRPAIPEVIAEVARHVRWSQRGRIRLAILMNPGSPPEVALPLVQLLTQPDLRAVGASAHVPKVVRAAAIELMARKPWGSARPREDADKH